MRRTKIAALVLFGISLVSCAAQLSVTDKDRIEYYRRLASHPKTAFLRRESFPTKRLLRQWQRQWQFPSGEEP